MASNNTENVSVGKGVEGGYMFIAPFGTTLPSNNTSVLGGAFLNMGYLGDDGITFSDSSDSDSFYDLNGDTIATSAGSVEKTFTVVFREIKKDTLAVIYGDDNVVDEDGVITVHDKGQNDTAYAVVFELLLKDGRKWRRCAENVKLGELGDQTVVYSDLVGREVTMSVLKGTESGDYWTDYIDSTETTGA